MYTAFFNLGYQEIILILIVAVLLFGGRLPEVSRNVGRWLFDLKKGMNDINRDIYAPPPPEAPARRPGADARSVPRHDHLLLDAEVAPAGDETKLREAEPQRKEDRGEKVDDPT